MHTRVAPKGTLLDPDHYADVVADVRDLLAERIAAAEAAGVDPEQLLLDPGPDFAKTPAQTVAVLRRLDVLHALGRPLLLARLPQGLPRRDHRPRRRASAARPRSPPSAGRPTRARTCCACTTSRPRPTSSPCAPCCAATRVLDTPARGSRRTAIPAGYPG